MRNRVHIIYLILFVIALACNKEDSGLNQNNTGLLYQLEFDHVLYSEYTYNASSQILEEKSKLHYTRHNYKAGKLISSDYYVDPGMFSSTAEIADASFNRKEWVDPTNTEKSSTNNYFYDDKGQFIKSSNNLNSCEYSYDEKNRINRQTFFHENERTGYLDFSYDENDNLIRKQHYWILDSGDSELQTTTEYEFDNKLNPYKAFSSLMIPGQNTNTNNIIRETYILHFEVDQYTENVQITENDYTYNSLGFPATKNNSVNYIYH
ncbi:MAG: hypothetical protein ACERKD_00765 [Prolixibacteraceae bacterium]